MDLKRKSGTGEIGGGEAAAMIVKRFPQLHPDHVDHTLSQAGYFAMK
jgi:hypothetical protein